MFISFSKELLLSYGDCSHVSYNCQFGDIMGSLAQHANFTITNATALSVMQIQHFTKFFQHFPLLFSAKVNRANNRSLHSLSFMKCFALFSPEKNRYRVASLLKHENFIVANVFCRLKCWKAVTQSCKTTFPTKIQPRRKSFSEHRILWDHIKLTTQLSLTVSGMAGTSSSTWSHEVRENSPSVDDVY